MKRILAGRAALLFFCAAACAAAAAAPQTPEPPTITSDALEIRDNGALTVFTGHVVLNSPPYVLHADRMNRTRDTGRVEARGHVRGVWEEPGGGKVLAEGDQARYDSLKQVTDLWGQSRMTRWETRADTSPVVVTADHFTAWQTEQIVWAVGNVRMHQGNRLRSVSEEAKYDRQKDTVDLWGPSRVKIHVEDAKGNADFISDKAWMALGLKHARLIDHVQGHVVPAP